MKRPHPSTVASIAVVTMSAIVVVASCRDCARHFHLISVLDSPATVRAKELLRDRLILYETMR